MRTGKLKNGRPWRRYVLPAMAACVAISSLAASSDSAGRLLPAFGEEAILNFHQPRGPITNILGATGVDSNPSIATGSDGLWIAVWHSSDTRGGTLGKDWDIFMSRSTDGGETWEADTLLNSNGAEDIGDDLSPAAATDGKGNWVVAWASNEPFGNTFGRDRDILYCRSTDNGLTWSAPTALNVNAAHDYGHDWAVRLATDARGNWVAVWASTDSMVDLIGGDADIFVARSRDDGASWTHPMPLNSNAAYDTGFDGTPDIVADHDGNWAAVWSASDSREQVMGEERDVFIARSTDAGGSWTDPQALNQNAAKDDRNDLSPRIASNGKGVWVAVWSSADSLGGVIGFDSDLLLTRSDDYGVTWTQPSPIDPRAEMDAQDDASPSIVTDGKGKWMAVWHSFSALSSYGTADSDVVVTVSQDEGLTWSEPRPISRSAPDDEVDDSHPQLATDGDGNWVVVWQTYSVHGGTTVTDDVSSGWTVQTAHGRLVESTDSE